MITFRKQVTPDYEQITCPVGSCWKFGNWFYAKIIAENQILEIFDCDKRPSIAITSSMTSNDWQPSDNDVFIAAYCKAINTISGLSGIEHLPLKMEPDFLNENNPES
jgi:hypothetical protein